MVGGQGGVVSVGRARGRKSGKISILNKGNFVPQSPDCHCSPFAMFANFLCPFGFFFLFFNYSCLLSLQLPASSLSRALQDGVSALNFCANLMNCISHTFEMNVQDAWLFLLFFSPSYSMSAWSSCACHSRFSIHILY